MPRPLGMATTVILATLQEGRRYGLDIAEGANLKTGTVYTTLRRLEERGHVRGRWEDPGIAEEEGRPRRRYYVLTAEGRAALAEAMSRFRALARELPAADGVP